MSEINFTPKQLEVLNHDNGNLLVSASAGSGKTKVMVEKIVNCILKGEASVNELLVVTFTNSASSEMKQKISDKIQNSKDEILRSQLDLLSVSDIMSFDKFCIKIVKEFGYKIGVSSNFGIADDCLAGYLKNKALENILSKHNSELSPDYVSLLDAFYEKRNDKELKKSLVKINNFVHSLEVDKEVFYSLVEQNNTIKADNPVLIYLNNYLLKNVNYYISKLDELRDQASIQKNDKIIDGLSNIKESLLLLSSDLLKNIEIIRSIKFDIGKGSKNEIVEVAEIRDKFKTLKEEFKKLKKPFDEIKDLTNNQMVSDAEDNKAMIKSLLKLNDEFDDEYSSLKTYYQVLDFNDIERFANKILLDKNTAETFQNRYKYIFIDEYQDTSPLQEGIVKKITTGSNLFMVGDIKQSIYKFRLAEPKIFLNKYYLYKQCIAQGEVKELNCNFRSEKGILEFANMVFDNIMRKSTGGIDYKGNADLEYGNVIKSCSTNNVNIYIFDKQTKKTENEELQNLEAYSVKDAKTQNEEEKYIQKEAFFLAKKIKEIVNTVDFYDIGTKTFRKVGYKDISIISRNKKNVMETVRDVLKQNNIPVICEIKNSLYDNNDIQLILSVLKLIENEQDDYALLNVLASGIGHVSLEEMAEIRSLERDYNFFHIAVSNYLLNYNNSLTDKIKLVKNKIKKYRQYSNYKDLCELVISIVTEENLEEYYSINNDGEEFESHLQLLLQNLKGIKDYNLTEYLNYIETFSDDLSYDEIIKDGDDAVTIQTIYSSKGLEYPVVFFIDTGRAIDVQSAKSQVLIDNDFGITKQAYNIENRCKYKNLIFMGFKTKIKEEFTMEEMRLMYVAMTRPKNYLYIIGTTKLDNIKALSSDLEIFSAGSYLSWILGSIKESDLTNLKLKKSIIIKLNSSDAGLYVVENNNIQNEAEIEKNINKDYVIDNKKFTNILNYKFGINNLAKKNSVTQIMQEEDHYNISNLEWQRNDKTGDEDFLAIGTTYHKIMEKIEFNENETQLQDQIKNMLDKGIIPIDMIKKVDISSIIKASQFLLGVIDPADIVMREKPFLMYMPANKLIKTEKTNQILIQGVADLIIIKAREIWLVDYKTSRIQNKEGFIKKYKTQLDIYSKAIEDFYQKPVTKKIIYSFFLSAPVLI